MLTSGESKESNGGKKYSSEISNYNIKMGLVLKKRLAKCLIWTIALYRTET